MNSCTELTSTHLTTQSGVWIISVISYKERGTSATVNLNTSDREQLFIFLKILALKQPPTVMWNSDDSPALVEPATLWQSYSEAC